MVEDGDQEQSPAWSIEHEQLELIELIELIELACALYIMRGGEGTITILRGKDFGFVDLCGKKTKEDGKRMRKKHKKHEKLKTTPRILARKRRIYNNGLWNVGISERSSLLLRTRANNSISG